MTGPFTGLAETLGDPRPSQPWVAMALAEMTKFARSFANESAPRSAAAPALDGEVQKYRHGLGTDAKGNAAPRRARRL